MNFVYTIDTYVETIQNFDKRSPGDLTIQTGDIITFVKEHEDGYMEGRLGEDEGLFPVSSVKTCEMEKQGTKIRKFEL